MAASDNCISSILIVGGGTAGWMTAALLNRFLPADRCRITLVESADIGSIGVGEATVPPLVSYLKAIGVNEDEFMRETHASYKLGVKFIDWHRGDDALWHPFGQIGGLIDHVQVFHHWVRARREGRETAPYDALSLQATLGNLHKSPRALGGSSTVMERGAYAYHLDAKAFAGFLARLATGRGVRHVVDNVRGVVRDERGFIGQVETAQHGKLAADLYVDCTGFAGLLVERTLGDRYIDWSNYLLCDRALALPLPSDGDMAPYTRATALSAGWSWRIPLSHRIGSGYVYSSAFTSDEAAARELVAHARQDADTAQPRLLHMRVGRRTNCWIGNCVAVGLASGFLEPIESTGIYLIQKSVELLLELFPDTGFGTARIAQYNHRMARTFEAVRDFIILHYVLNRRDDTPFWQANRRTVLPDSLAATLALYDETGTIDWDNSALFGEVSFYAIAAGFDRLPRHALPRTGYSDAARVAEIFAAIKAQNLKLAHSLPDHAEFMRQLHAMPAQPARMT
ncbi:MAG: tryptophan halogenase family protein [Betaproteobacteria bacterium]|jgi:tryptophan halogenase